MAVVNTNSISLAVAREAKIGQLPTSGEAEYLEPNDITTYGAEITTIARQPISKYRMAKKGTVVDISSSVEFAQDTTASLLLNMLEGGIYSRWVKRPHVTRKNVKALGVGKNIVPNYRGAYAGIDAALAAITNPLTGNWWNNTVDNKEWVYDGTVTPAKHFRGSYATVAAAKAAITNPQAGDWWNNTTDNLEYDYVNKTEPDPNYIGQFATPDAATASLSDDPVSGQWFDNLGDGHEWVYDGQTVAADGYVGQYASDTAVNAAVKNPNISMWFQNSTTNTEWNCKAVVAADGYKGEFADLAAAQTAITDPVDGDWFNNQDTNTEWNWSATSSQWENSNDPVTTRATLTGQWEDTNNANGTRDTTVTVWWKDSGLPIGTTPKFVDKPWEASTRAINTTPTTTTTWWKPSTRAAFTTATETILSAGGYNLLTPLPGAPVVGTLVYVRGFTNSKNNGLKVVGANSTKQIVYVTDTGIVTEDGTEDASFFVCGVQAGGSDLRIDADGNLTSSTLNFTTLGIEPHSGIFIGGVAPNTRFDTEADYGLCRVVKVEAHKITLDKHPNQFLADRGVGKQIHLYFGWFIRDVAVDHYLFNEQTFAFEATYPGVQDNGTDGYEYALGNLINTFEMTLPLTDKSVTTISTFGMDVMPITGAKQNWDRHRPLFQEAFSTPNDFIRLRLERADGYGLSTLFKECTLTLNNNAGGENVLGKLGPAFVNYGNFDVSLSFQCVFTNPDIPRMIRNNCTVTLDFCLVNNDGAFWFDIPSMTLGGGDKDFTANEKVKINLTSNAFGDPYPGYTIGVTYFPYLPNPKADACA